MLSESQWTAKLQRTLSGFALQAVRRGRGKYRKGAKKIPGWLLRLRWRQDRNRSGSVHVPKCD